MSDNLVWVSWTEDNEQEMESWSVIFPMTEAEFNQVSDLVKKCTSISDYFDETFTFKKLDFVPDKRSVELCDSLSNIGYYSAFQMFDYSDSLVNRLINALNEFFTNDDEEDCWLYKLKWLS